MKIEYNAIGVVHSPFLQQAGTPVQPSRAQGAEGWIEVFPEYQAGLADLNGFSHIILLCHMHQCEGYQLTVTPYLDNTPRGLFATRSPRRPNPIGLSIVELQRIVQNRLYIRNFDLLDGTPLLDIKPYVAEFDLRQDGRYGWFEQASQRTVADNRFANQQK